MNRPVWNVALLMAAMSVTLCVPSLAQVRQVQMGHALDTQLDMSLQVGSNRYNTPTPRTELPNAELIARGQVTGLAGFAGQRLVAPNELRLTTPSAILDNFMKQSVGVAQAQEGNNYAPTAFYVSSRTVYDPTSTSSASNTAPYSYTVSSRVSTAAAVEQAYTESRRLYEVVLPPVPKVVRSDVAILPQYIVPMDMSVTGLSITSEQRQRDSLSRELIDAQNALRDAGAPGADPRKRPPGPGIDGHRTHGILDPNDPEMLQGTRGGHVVPKKGQDAFTDVVMLMQEHREKLGGVSKPTSAVENAPGLEPGEANAPLIRLQDDQLVVDGLVGNRPDMFNQFMARGQAGLKAWRYYEAARSFELAAVLDNTNPLALIGQGTAVFGAGEFYSASILFRRAMEAFPPIMETRINMAGMMQDGDFAKQLKDLNDRANSEDADTPMLLLATFVNHNAGNTKAARTYAGRLVECDDAKPIVQTFALYVKNGKIPTALPAKQPTTPQPTTKPTAQPAAPKPTLNLPTAPKPNQPATPK